MTPEPRHEGDYTHRQVEAARRVLVDVGQVLASFREAIVVVGGWVPDLLFPGAKPEHVGSIDVDLALDASKLGDGRYAELLKLLLDTDRYEKGDKDFQLVTTVDLLDGEAPVRVDVEFLAAADVKLNKNHPKLIEDFRVLQFPATAAAFGQPENIEFEGAMISGAPNSVHLRVASLPDFIIMKAHAVGGRDKPKDVYDLCYCLDQFPDAIRVVAGDWRSRRENPLIGSAIEILKEKFKAVEHYGPQQLAIFYDSTDDDEREMHARRAFELVQKLLSLM
jgi:Nucleotidyl transferase AbiEii toxin, Type IV TA system